MPTWANNTLYLLHFTSRAWVNIFHHLMLIIAGQFFNKGVAIDEVRKILIMPNKEPVPVMRRPVWSFMERETADDQLCWTAMNPGYQGEGLIDGNHLDYIVKDIFSPVFAFNRYNEL